MRVLLQRVSRASVSVDTKTVAEIGPGLLLLVGFAAEDDERKLEKMASKVVHLRVFPDEAGRFHHSVLDIGGEVLAVPQFTLYGDTSKGRRPDFFAALSPEKAEVLFQSYCDALQALVGRSVPRGQFGAHMQVSLENDGPVTLMLEG